MPGFRSEEEEDDLFDSVSRMADRMGLKGAKRSQYIDDHMMQGGYERVQSRESYARVKQDEDEEDAGGRWGFGSRAGGSSRSSGRSRRDEDDSF